jgi:hypothetical protein
MALPASYPISFSQIKSEFSGPNNFRAYLGGGAYVQAGIGVPASGALHFSDFFGKSHVIPPTLFTSSNTYTVPAGVYSLTVLLVGGGGGGGASSAGFADGGGGGGAGGVIYNTTYPVTPGQVLSVAIGAGGRGGAGYAYLSDANGPTQGTNTNLGSVFAIGGGIGGYSVTSSPGVGGAGGSGGGANGTYGGNTGGSGVAGQGNAGGSSIDNGGNGGGGGAGAVGGNNSGAGGAGVTITLGGSSAAYGGGGGAGQSFAYYSATPRPGGAGGGGAGGYHPDNNPNSNGTTGTAGTANTGGGGGGGCGAWGGSARSGAGGAGGSGFVAIIPNASGTGTAIKTYNIAGPTYFIEDGLFYTYTVTTTNVPNGTVLYFKATGAMGLYTVPGSFTISGNTGTISIQALLNQSGYAYVFNILIMTGSTSGPIVGASAPITIQTVVAATNGGGGG